MNISIILGPFNGLPPNNTGSVEKRWYYVSSKFAERSHFVNIYLRRDLNDPQKIISEKMALTQKYTFRKKSSIYLCIIKDFLYSTGMAFHVTKADITVTNAFWLPVVLPILAPRSGKIVVNVARMPKGQLFLYGMADRLSAVSTAVMNEIVRQSPKSAKKTRVIPNPVDIQTFRPAKCKPTRTRRLILYAGRVHPEKGIDILVRACSDACHKGESLQLRILGPYKTEQGGGGPEYVSYLRSLADGVDIELCEPVFDKFALAEQYNAADIFVYPSVAEKGETFGVAPLEAMACGIPTIVSDLDCFKDFVSNGNNALIFDHRNASPHEMLSECLCNLINDKDTAKRLSVASVETASNFSVDKIADMYLADFEELLSKK